MLNAAIERIEETFRPRTQRNFLSAPWRRHAFAGLAAGLVIGAATALACYVALGDAFSSATNQRLQHLYSNGVPQIAEAKKFLTKVFFAVAARQKTDAVMAATSKSYVALSVFDPALAKEMPKTLPRGSSVVLRANGTDMKILLAGPLCATAAIAEPSLVDPVRSDPKFLGCNYMGLWTPGAARW
jgi:hypothetical protein